MNRLEKDKSLEELIREDLISRIDDTLSDKNPYMNGRITIEKPQAYIIAKDLAKAISTQYVKKTEVSNDDKMSQKDSSICDKGLEDIKQKIASKIYDYDRNDCEPPYNILCEDIQTMADLALSAIRQAYVKLDREKIENTLISEFLERRQGTSTSVNVAKEIADAIAEALEGE